MNKGLLIFLRVLQNSQELGTDDEHLVSRVYFSLKTPDGKILDLYSDVKLSPGADFTQDPLEASYPAELRGLLSYETFRQLVEQYYRDNIGATGRGIRIGPGAKGIVMMNNLFVMRKEVPVELIGPGSVGW